MIKGITDAAVKNFDITADAALAEVVENSPNMVDVQTAADPA